MDEKTLHIIKEVFKLYCDKGIKNITMDEVASHLSMSKKTLYMQFQDKENLIEKVLFYQIGLIMQKFDHAVKKEVNAIEKIFTVSSNILYAVNSIPANIIEDLRKYHPNLLSKILIHKRDHIIGEIKQNISEGISQGLYRENLNSDLVSKSYLALTESILEVTPEDEKGNNSEVMKELLSYHLRGISSKKGLQFLDKYLNNL